MFLIYNNKVKLCAIVSVLIFTIGYLINILWISYNFTNNRRLEEPIFIRKFNSSGKQVDDSKNVTLQQSESRDLVTKFGRLSRIFWPSTIVDKILLCESFS